MLREHAGDSLDDIARELAVQPATLRQRLSRLRRRLRAVYAVPFVLLLAASAGYSLKYGAPPPSVAGTVDPSLAVFAGTWRVVDAAPHRAVATTLTVLVGGESAWVRDPTGLVVRQLHLSVISPKRVKVIGGEASWDTVVVVRDRDHVELRSPRGMVVLARAR